MTTTTAKADRFANRAPKGGAVSPVNGLFYAGGQFMPMAVAGFTSAPATVEGSVRQVAWATRLKRDGLAGFDAALARVNAALAVATREEAPVLRTVARRLAIGRHTLKAEKSAAAIIERRAVAMA